MKIEIKSWWTGAVLFALDEDGLTLKVAVERAVRMGVRLDGAWLDGARLDGARLDGARLDGAWLVGASLVGARLDGASLVGARLNDAQLAGANIACGLTLVGHHPYIQIGPIGSRADTLHVYLTDKGIYIRAGCFFGTRDKFATKVAETHGDNQHGREYAAALVLIDAHAREWMPVAEQKVVV